MDINLWISILLAIPLAIIGNIFTPKFQAWLDRRAKKRSFKRTRNLKAEYEEVKRFFENREIFKEFLLWVVIKATLVGSIVAIFAGLMFAIPHLLRNIYEITGLSLVKSGYFDIRSLIYAAGQFISMIGAIMIVNICSKGLRTYTKVNDFGNYELEVKRLIGNKLKTSSTDEESD